MRCIADLCRTSKRALQWIERCGDRDGDGFVEYAAHAARASGASAQPGLEGQLRLAA